jgi:energy-coupling factor transport system permease protein
MTFAAGVFLMILNDWTPLVVSLGLLTILLLFFHLGRSWLRFLKSLGFAVLVFFIIAWLAFDMNTGIVSGLRLLTVGTVFFLFFQTTPPDTLSNGLLKMGVPYPFTFVLTASMQFIPVLAHRARNIRDAQRARGIPVEGGPAMLLHLPALAGPLLIQAFKFADELAEAMEARGFGIPRRRFRHEPRFRWVDWAAVAISITALATSLAI